MMRRQLLLTGMVSIAAALTAWLILS